MIVLISGDILTDRHSVSTIATLGGCDGRCDSAHGRHSRTRDETARTVEADTHVRLRTMAIAESSRGKMRGWRGYDSTGWCIWSDSWVGLPRFYDVQLTGWEMIRLLIFQLAAGFWDTHNPSNASLTIWLSCPASCSVTSANFPSGQAEPVKVNPNQPNHPNRWTTLYYYLL